MDERILKAELSKSLTEDETIALETQKQVLEANVGLRDKTLDAVGAMAKASEEITFKEGEALELRKLIADSAKNRGKENKRTYKASRSFGSRKNCSLST